MSRLDAEIYPDFFFTVNWVTVSFWSYLLNTPVLYPPLSISMANVLLHSHPFLLDNGNECYLSPALNFYKETCNSFCFLPQLLHSVQDPSQIGLSKSISHLSLPHPMFQVPYIVVLLGNNVPSYSVCAWIHQPFIGSSASHFLLETVLLTEKGSPTVFSLKLLSISLCLWPLCHSRCHLKL